MKYNFKFLPSTEKCFIDDNADDKYGIEKLSMLRNERLSFQLAYWGSEMDWHTFFTHLEIESDIKEYVKVYRVEQVPVTYPKRPDLPMDGYLRD